jgi:ribonuclease III
MTTRRSKDSQIPGAAAASPLEVRLGHTFAHPELLQLAITHRSWAYEARGGAIHPPGPETSKTQISKQKNPPGTDNEQLEFLGDAILGLIVAEALFRAFPQSSEGELTRMRSALVSRKRMSEFGAVLGLEEHLLLGKSAEQNGGRRKPALLANAAEAVIAAMYLDSVDKGQAAARTLVHQHLIEPELDAMRQALAKDTGRGALRDHKTLLQERVQAAASGRLRYIDVSQSGPAHQRQFAVQAQLEDEFGTRVLASAEGPSKKEAQQRAAELALAAWNAAPAQEPA